MKRSHLFLGLYLFLFFPSVRAQVNPQNGAAQISLPLYSYSDAGNRLGLSASLDYVDGNGLKVSEMASEVGTGWNLNCGGMIQRIQHGEPDDQKMDNPPAFTQSNLPVYVNSYYPDGYLYNSPTYNPSDVIDNGAAYSPYSTSFASNENNYKLSPQYLADRDQDIFAFSFNGRTGEFVIGKNGQVVTLNDSKLQISFQQTDMTPNNIRTRINQFTITDEMGIQYVFKDLELDYVSAYSDLRWVNQDFANIDAIPSQALGLLSQFSNNGNAVNVVLGTIPTQNYLVVNKWYLSRIVNPFTGKQVLFTYSTYEEDINTDKSMSSSNANGSFNVTNATVFWHRYKVRGLRLSNILLSNAERLDFIYSSTSRKDLPHQYSLSQLQVSYNGNAVYSWMFGYGYMVGIDNAIKMPGDSYTQTELNWSRLCLLTLQRTGVNGFNESPYKFAYNLGGDNNQRIDVVPPMFSIYQDMYGYYNATLALDNVQNEGFENSFYAVTALNTLVNNSAGTFKNIAAGVAKNGTLQSVSYPFGGSLSFTYENNRAQAGLIGGVRVNQTMQYDGISHGNDVIKQYSYVNTDGTTTSGWGGETFAYSTSGSATATGCATKESPTAIVREVAMAYLQKAFLYHTVSIASAEIVGTELCDMLGQVEIAFLIAAIIGDNQTPPTTTTSYVTHLSQSLSDNNPLPSGYARTAIKTLNGSGNAGTVVYTFSNPNEPNIAINVPTLSVPYSNKPRYASWVYGLPESVTYYDNTGTKMVKQTINHYNYIVNTLTNSNFQSKSWAAVGAAYGCAYQSSDQTNTLINQETYYPLTGHTELTSSDEILYNTLQQSTTVTTSYEYDNNFQLKHQYFNNSKGEKTETFYYHPYDYTQATGAIGIMNQSASNIIAPVISTETYLDKSNNTQYLVKATATNYQVASNGDLKPSSIYSFQSALPVSSTVLQPFNAASVQRDPNYYIQTVTYGYDINGNLVQTVSGGNRITGSLYDYTGQLQVAVVNNASYNDICFTSFEAEGGKPGSRVNTAAIVSTDARTGSKCFNLSDNSNSVNGYFSFSGFNNTLSYIVSFWSKNGSACITGQKAGSTVYSGCQGGSGWKQGETANGWTYYEVQVNSADQISVSGTGLIDEFRVYPVGAMMNTTTYAPLIGKTSECDAAGKVTYYQYDEIGRLRYILDDQKNIVRMYDYNYKQ